MEAESGTDGSLKNMEWKTFLVTRAELDYKGIGRAGWVGDYMDPYSFLNLFYTKGGDNGTGWWDPEFVRLLDEAIALWIRVSDMSCWPRPKLTCWRPNL